MPTSDERQREKYGEKKREINENILFDRKPPRARGESRAEIAKLK